ncbi:MULTISPECIES: hypothetical protein [unclassified Sphingomonas]|uniref:hypothetical protein n=1 Tax=unclassified Sphingomonas TaxID=196159 RepID=UPI0010F59C85|nr:MULTISPECIES: hypothetical protein [unclassified Sphingomonas]
MVRPYALFATRKGGVPAWLKLWLLKTLNFPLLRQDQRMLAEQIEALEDWDEVNFIIGPADLIGPTVWRLANGQPQRVELRDTTLYL